MKKIILILFVFVIGCTGTRRAKDPVFTIAPQKGEIKITTVGVLLPMSGPNAKIGEVLKNTAMMASSDMKNDKMILRFYDTEGTAESARDATEAAIKDGAGLIIGPLFSHEVEVSKKIAVSRNIPMLVLSSDPVVVERGVYTVSVLLPQQVDRIVTYACEKGKRKIAVLAQDTPTGKMMIDAAEASIERCGGRITKKGYYNVKKGTYDKAVKEIIGPERIAWIDEERKKSKLKKPKTLGGEEIPLEVDENVMPKLAFDAVLIAEEGNRLRSIGSLLSFYEINAQLLGTSLWANDTNIQKESALVGSWYAAPPQRAFTAFKGQYKKLFDDTPPRITGQMYDAVKIASTLVEQNAVTERGVTESHGFLGIDGPVRLLPSGLSERGLEIKKVQKNSLPTLSEIEPFNDTDPYYLNRKSGIETLPEAEKPEPEKITLENGEALSAPVVNVKPVYIIDAPMD